MNFEKFQEELKKLNIEDKKMVADFVETININNDNFDKWVEYVFSDKITELDLDKLPYIIDLLFKTDNKFKFMLCCMLIESTCEILPFITNLENYLIYKEKYDILKNTLVTVYERVDNGIANCMSLIVLNNDPKLELFNAEEKERLLKATTRKLNDILYYLENTNNINELVYNDIEIIIDFAVYLKDSNISQLVEKISNYKMNFSNELFIIKYKIINNMEIDNEKIQELINNRNELSRVINVFEKNNALDKLDLSLITQQDIARSNMIKWLEYPTELGKAPDEIELLGEVEHNNYIYYIYKFKCSTFRIKDFMLGISGGYEKNKITSIDTGYTFSNFEFVKEDYEKQAREIIEMIQKHWMERFNG